jgi:hypothetical protein
VGKLKKGFISFFVVAFIFSFNLSVLAEEGHDENVKQATENANNGTNSEHSEEADTHSQQADSHSEEAEAHDNEAEAHGDEEEADDHHGPVVETPPNYKVLGSYGAVNLSFILIGVWNKWFRRKGNK